MLYDVMCENNTLRLQIYTEYYMKILTFIIRLWIFLCKIITNIFLHVYNCEIVSELSGEYSSKLFTRGIQFLSFFNLELI